MEQQPMQEPTTKEKKTISLAIGVALVVALLAALAGLAYFALDSNDDASGVNTDQESNSESGELDDKDTPSEVDEAATDSDTSFDRVSTKLILGGTRLLDDGTGAGVDFSAAEGFKDVTVLYGTNPTNLDKTAEYTGGGLGNVIDGYGRFNHLLENLPSGIYFYQLVGTLENGDKEYSGIGTFTLK